MDISYCHMPIYVSNICKRIGEASKCILHHVMVLTPHDNYQFCNPHLCWHLEVKGFEEIKWLTLI